MTATHVRADQRWSRSDPCPICDGHPALPHGHGQRCYGFRSSDGAYAHCTREELAGPLRPDPDGQTYAHRLSGECKCGQTHNERRDAFSVGPATNGAARREVARYPYLDEEGELLYTVRKYDPKDFRPFLPGASVPGLGTVRRVPYRLPQLLAADPAAPVFALEGEQDTDNVAALGLVASCSQGGAGQCRQWLDPAFVAPFAGRPVVIVPDNDKEGDRYAETVARGLAGVAKSIATLRLPGLPPKGDVTDWLAAGGTAAELLALASALDTEAAPPGRWVSLADVLDAKPPAWLIDDILTRNSTAVLGGKWGSFKSFIALDLVLSVAAGRVWGGKSVEPGPTAYIVAEGYGGFGPRVRAWLTVHQRAPEDIPIRFLPVAPNFQDDGQVDQLMKELVAFSPPPALIVVDTLARTNVGAEENSAKDMGAYFAVCQQLQQLTGACVLVLHHPTKNGDTLRGSGAIGGAADTIIIVTRQDAERVQITCEKQKDGAEFAPLRFKRHIVDLGDGVTSVVMQPYVPFRVTGEPQNDNERQALDALNRVGGKATYTRWCSSSGLANSSFARAVAGLETAGLVGKRGDGKGAVYHNEAPMDGSDTGGIGSDVGSDNPGEPGSDWERRGSDTPSDDAKIGRSRITPTFLPTTRGNITPITPTPYKGGGWE